MPVRVNTSGAIALVFDFDDTLAPDSTSKLLMEHGFSEDEVADFWEVKARRLVKQGYDPAHAYLKLLLDEIHEEGRLGSLTNQALREFGRTLDEDFYSGIPEVFDDLRGIVAKHPGLSIQFFIVSGGLEDVIRGSEIVQTHFQGLYGCLLAGETDDGPLRHIRRAITFSEKTRFLFEINKGLAAQETLVNPLLVNRDIPEDRRPVPFENMIYLGDGLTDIPCFSLIEAMDGKAFGILQREKAISGKSALAEMLGPRRARSLNAPLYRREDDLGIILRTTVAGICSDILYRRSQA